MSDILDTYTHIPPHIERKRELSELIEKNLDDGENYGKAYRLYKNYSDSNKTPENLFGLLKAFSSGIISVGEQFP